jgi:hypothetical protein
MHICYFLTLIAGTPEFGSIRSINIYIYIYIYIYNTKNTIIIEHNSVCIMYRYSYYTKCTAKNFKILSTETQILCRVLEYVQEKVASERTIMCGIYLIMATRSEDHCVIGCAVMQVGHRLPEYTESRFRQL